MIIKGLFGNNDDNNTIKKAELKKFCSICQHSLDEAKDGDDFYCKECKDTGKTSNKEASYWKTYYASKKLNSLNPKMQKLADVLKDSSLLNGLTSNQKLHTTVHEKTLNELNVNAFKSKKAPYDDVKYQVQQILPHVLAELNLVNKVDAELLLDFIVPSKIAQPLTDTLSAKSVIRDIVLKSFVINNPEVLGKRGIQPHGIVPTHNANDIVLDEGVRRISSDYGTRTRSILQIAEEQPLDLHTDSEDNDYLPSGDLGKDEEPSKDVADSEKLNDDKDSHEDLPENVLKEASFTRMYRSSQPSRNLFDIAKNTHSEKAKTSLLKFANKLNAAFPVENIKLEAQDRKIITSYPPITHFAAEFLDNTQTNWNCYKTDNGYLLLSDNTAFHAKSLKAFAEFIESDDTFNDWNSVPEEAVTTEQIPEPSPIHIMQPPAIKVCDCEGNGHESQEDHNQEMLLNMVLQLLPEVENLFPEDDENTQYDLALNAALDVLENKIEHSAGVIDKAIVNETGKALNNFVSKVPGSKDVAKATKPFMGVAESSSHGNAGFSALENALPSLITGKSTDKKAYVEIPQDKQNHINQIVSQLYGTKDEEGAINLMASLKQSTPHLSDSGRKAMLPKMFHPVYEKMIVANAIDEKDNSEEKDESLDKECSLDELMSITADLSNNDFEMSFEALLDLGYTSEMILAVAEHRFTKKEDRQAKHIEESEEKEGKSADKAKQIGFATVNKLKNK